MTQAQVEVHVARIKLVRKRENLGARPLRNPLGPVCLGNPDDCGKQRGNSEGNRGALLFRVISLITVHRGGA